MIITIIPCPDITSANMNPEEIQMSSLKGILFSVLVIEKMCPRACSVLKYGDNCQLTTSLSGDNITLSVNNGTLSVDNIIVS